MESNNAITTQNKTPIRNGQQGLQLSDMDQMWRFAQMVVASDLCPRGFKKPEQVMLALEAGAELGLRPFQSLQALAVINGKVSIYGDALKAIVEASPECEYIVETVEGEGEKMIACCKAKRRNRPQECIRFFTYQDAKLAGLLGKDTYKQFPKRMFQMRARSYCLRDQFADLLCGLVAVEEVQDYDAIEGQLVSGAPAPQQGVQSLLEAMDADDAEQGSDDYPHASTPWDLIENTKDDEEARKVYDNYCGPESEADQNTRERCENAWRKRNGIDAKTHADNLFGEPA